MIVSRRRSRPSCGLLLVAALALGPGCLTAQTQRPPPRESSFSPEVRVDGIFARIDAIHVGLGGTIPLGNYVRAGLVAASGLSKDGPSSRIDFIARFHLDPFRESRWAPYAGGGLTTRFDKGANAHTYLMVLAGADGPVRKGIAVSAEAALGGGGRVGIILRRTRTERR